MSTFATRRSLTLFFVATSALLAVALNASLADTGSPQPVAAVAGGVDSGASIVGRAGATEPAVVPDRMAAPASLRREVTPLPAATPAESPLPPLPPQVRESVATIARLTGIQSSRIEELARGQPDLLGDLRMLVDTLYTGVSQQETRLDAIQQEIVRQRIERGQFEVVELNGPPPTASLSFETVQSGIYYDADLGHDVRRVVRILTGEDSRFDEARDAFLLDRAGARAAVEDYLRLSAAALVK